VANSSIQGGKIGLNNCDTKTSLTRKQQAHGKTPYELVADQPIRLLSSTYDGLQRDLPLLKDHILFSLVRKSGRITTFASDKFDIDPDL
jgi:hypothetical protein